jgi:hypothetical protein
MNHNTPTHTRHRFFIRMEAWTCINHRVPCMPLFSAFMSTPTLKSSHKPRQLAPTVGPSRSDYKRSMVFQSTTKFLPSSRWFLGSLLFNANKFGDLSLQGLETWEVIGLGTDCLPPAPVQVRLINEAQLRHRCGSLKGYSWPQLGCFDSLNRSDLPVATRV